MYVCACVSELLSGGNTTPVSAVVENKDSEGVQGEVITQNFLVEAKDCLSKKVHYQANDTLRLGYTQIEFRLLFKLPFRQSHLFNRVLLRLLVFLAHSTEGPPFNTDQPCIFIFLPTVTKIWK